MNNCLECGEILVQTRKDHIKKFCNSKCANTHKARVHGSPFSDPKVQDKIKNTNLKKYGVDNVWKSKKVQSKIASNKDYSQIIPKTVATTKERHGDDFYKRKWKIYNQRNISQDTIDKLSNADWLKTQHEEKSLSVIADELNISVTMVWEYAKSHGIETRKHKSSKLEHTVKEFLTTNNIEFSENDRTQFSNKKELDFFIPSKRVGIEVHGVYWHSDKFQPKEHLREKYDLAREAGIDLLQFTEEDINTKFDIVSSIILNRLNMISNKLYARCCGIQVVDDSDVVNKFYDDNHIQGSFPSKHNIGLFFSGNLVSLMSFSKPRFSREHDYELTRFASIKNTNIIGGASKLFSFFIKTFNPSSIVSYSDMQYFTGTLYEKLGFLTVKETKPSYSYVVGNGLVSRMNFQKKNITKQFPDADMSLTEEVLVSKYYGYHRFYHVGQRVHVWNFTTP